MHPWTILFSSIYADGNEYDFEEIDNADNELIRIRVLLWTSQKNL